MLRATVFYMEKEFTLVLINLLAIMSGLFILMAINVSQMLATIFMLCATVITFVHFVYLQSTPSL
jgi:hypothetical protein